MPFPFSLLWLLPLRMLNIDAEKLTIVCLCSYLHFDLIVDSFFYPGIIDLLCYLACMLIKPKLEYTALLGYKIEISLQNLAIEQRISGIVFCLNNIFISLPFLCYVDDQWGG